jgi:hypothetical protein
MTTSMPLATTVAAQSNQRAGNAVIATDESITRSGYLTSRG